MKTVFFLLCFIFTSQLWSQEVVCNLPDYISESSGLLCIGDSVFITHNDSGNKNELYVLNTKGEVLNTCTINGARNKDWEDLCLVDDSLIYIADIGNNNNTRKDLKLYIVDLHEVLTQKESKADSINFTYPDQKEFPPSEAQKYYDAEAICYFQNKIWIFTKNRTVPFDGVSKVYTLPKKPGKYKATVHTSLQLKASSWMEDCITSVCLEQNHLFVLTYSKIYIYQVVNGKLVWKNTRLLNRFGMWEAIHVHQSNIYLSEEKTIIAPKIYKLRWK
ncbi:hypothetical protein SAMN05216474_3121 [Lishizhenia tianjinensis]|uniref:T9SS C-terminal target domain-containing protein n=1 Tax=Lishizhenia tianjinensis TaxID=477690 RepID=A0A1I7BVU4_9FLAO|nr:hypothetical protein [Lishizhenia tianjinensis]SFT91260.1 hypothetical protein SAMN05216474_3121 [Lishizhenia tianjinensis]